MLTAEEAKKIREEAIANKANQYLEDIESRIREASKKGLDKIYNNGNYTPYGWRNGKEVIEKIITNLREAGYTVEVKGEEIAIGW